VLASSEAFLAEAVFPNYVWRHGRHARSRRTAPSSGFRRVSERAPGRSLNDGVDVPLGRLSGLVAVRMGVVTSRESNRCEGVPLATELKDKKIAFLFTEGVEQVELTEPLRAMREAGADTTLVSLETGEVQMFNHLDKGETIEAELATGDADASSFDALVLPGGVDEL
jgi:DJ-1/PfpI family